MEEVLKIIAYIAAICGGFSTAVAVGLPALGKYPEALRRNISAFFTGDLEEKMTKEIRDLRYELDASVRTSGTTQTQAIHDLTTIVEANRTEHEQALHAHMTAPGLHNNPFGEVQ